MKLGFVKAHYRGVPCYFNQITNEIEGRNWIYKILLDQAIWYDMEFGDGFYIRIDDEDDIFY